jgi:muramoyltetrapeptide carboxypeptidase
LLPIVHNGLMTRRTALLTSGFAPGLLAQSSSPVVKPKPLRPGDLVAVVTPSTYVSDPVQMDLAIRTVEHFGLRARLGANVRKRSGYLGGSIDERVADVHAAFRDPEVKGIFCIRGGYGSPQLLDRLDYALIRRNPKVFAGYSDITALHLAILRHAGLVTFHSPVVLSRFTDFSQRHFREAVFGGPASRTIVNPPEDNPLRPLHPTRAIRPGKVRGPLVGGNLTLLSALMGTPYEPDTRGRIFFLEDVGEEPYRIDRMLTQLRLAGKFDQCAGVVVGECVDCNPREFQPGFQSTFSLNEVLEDILGTLKVPVLTGLLIGHTNDQATLPMGVPAELDTANASLTVLEPGVSVG